MYLDAHTHLYSFGEKLPETLEYMNRERIYVMDCTIHPEDYLWSKKIGSENPLILTGFGIHPWESVNYHENLEQYLPYMKEAPFIGEIGLDFFWVTDASAFEVQRKVCTFLLKESARLGKMANLHTKGAEEEIFTLLRKTDHPKAVIHWYSGPRHVFDRLLDFGCRFTIGVDVHESLQTREMVALLPLDRILAETDGPEAKAWLTGQSGTPQDLLEVIRTIAEIKGLNVEDVQKATYENGMAWLS